MKSTYFFYQDSLSVQVSDTAASLLPGVDSSESIRKFSSEEVDDIFRAMERREKVRDSIAKVRAHQAYLRSIREKESMGFDTAAVPYNFSTAEYTGQDNALRLLSKKYYNSKDTSRPVFHEEFLTVSKEVAPAAVTEQTPDKTPQYSHDMRPDWLIGVILISLILLASLRIFFNKFLDQTIQSLANYQLSSKLLRDQSIFSRRVAFALNLNFILVGGALIYLMMAYFGFSPLPFGDFLCFFSYMLIFAFLIFLRILVSNFIGSVFRKQFEFREYMHQLLLIYKNLGIYLIVMIIGITYINEELRLYLVWLALIMVIAGMGLRIFKGIQIILSNKGILIFYLILYLCTLEILPLLIFYRFFSLSVQAG